MRNLTPHPITVRMPDGSEITYPPAGAVARVVMREEDVPPLGCIPVIRRVAGNVVGLPDDGSACLVSSMVLAALPPGTFPNAFAPDTGPTAVRNAAGHIVAVTRLVRA